jgi:hypothetical protein
VVSFDRSRFKLFTLRISNKSVQRLKTVQRTLFLLLEINYRFQTRHQYRAATQFFHNALYCRKSSPLTEENLLKHATIPSDIWTVGKELIALFGLSTWLVSYPDFFI